MFDVNPTAGDNPKFLNSSIDYDSNEALPETALDACDWYRFNRIDALAEARTMAHALAGWRKIATTNGISKASVEYMARCFDAGIARLQSLTA